MLFPSCLVSFLCDLRSLSSLLPHCPYHHNCLSLGCSKAWRTGFILVSPQRSQVRLFKGVLHDATVLCRGTKSSISTHHPLLQATLYGVLWLLPPSCSLLTWLASGTSPSLNTLTHTYTHPYYPLHPKATFSEMLPGHTAKSHPPLLPPLFLCLCLPILICMKSISISISILYLNIITYIKFICFLIDSVSL